MARKGTGQQQKTHLADMSLPPEQRGRHKTTRTSRRPVPAQLGRGNTPAGRRRARDGERLLEQERQGGDPHVV